MELTDEVIEMWEADAQRGDRDTTRANARIVRLIRELGETTALLAEMTQKLIDADPAFASRIRVALGEAA